MVHQMFLIKYNIRINNLALKERELRHKENQQAEEEKKKKLEARKKLADPKKPSSIAKQAVQAQQRTIAALSSPPVLGAQASAATPQPPKTSAVKHSVPITPTQAKKSALTLFAGLGTSSVKK
jgi:hypothetical protein